MDYLWSQLSVEAAERRLEFSKQQLEFKHRELSKTATGNDLRESLIRYARADCLQLATMMLEKLPTEVRGLVYQHLCIEDRPIPVGPHYHSRKYDREEFQDSALVVLSEQHSGADVDDDDEDIEYEDQVIETPDGRLKRDHTYKPPSDMVLPSSHIFNPRYVGVKISFELQKVYYTRNTFSICTVEQGIRNFLQLHTGYAMRKWKNGTPPSMPKDLILQPPFLPGDYVCNLQIRIKAEQLNGIALPDISSEEECPEKEKQLLESIRDNLLGLDVQSLLGASRKLNIEFIIMSALNEEGNENGHRDDCCGAMNLTDTYRACDGSGQETRAHWNMVLPWDEWSCLVTIEIYGIITPWTVALPIASVHGTYTVPTTVHLCCVPEDQVRRLRVSEGETTALVPYHDGLTADDSFTNKKNGPFFNMQAEVSKRRLVV
ncbi:predicted protein [Plenodomus lingam JN3]|uniref:Uncharacterized protein n=1 Tax=Leptosphaeria maculans (strain JN3 / isolate v23.1.3 / race Av1-4-5-6-7-8) TaxID=985895 RepID=E5A6P5_LEPMJ|nr:predicted protein [Plenodomus lingam JN3]CBX99290.1 predicted protein [Plenodomus lingam JN3]